MTAIFVTGATGLVGGGALPRLLEANPGLVAYALVRDLAAWRRAAARRRFPDDRVVPVLGDLTRPGLGLGRPLRRRLAAEVRAVLHLAADTTFSRPLEAARRTNVEGTRRVLELAAEWPGVERFAFVSTAFVAGRRVGRVAEEELEHDAGWVNAYERSKHEAEMLVRAFPHGWIVLRPSTIVCDASTGAVTQLNAVHRALRLFHHGLAPMLPGTDATPVEVVPSGYVAAAVADLALRPGIEGRSYHLCAGRGALPLGELLDLTYDVWAQAPAWRRKAIPRPALADLATYRLFERSVEELGDARLRRVVRSLSHFAPQLALPKEFDTTGADLELGYAAPAVRTYWPRMVEHLVATRWSPVPARFAQGGRTRLAPAVPVPTS